MNACNSIIENKSEYSAPVFVVGVPRSGTSMTALGLSLPDEVCYLGETFVFATVYYAFASLSKALPVALKTGSLIDNPTSLVRTRIRSVKDCFNGYDRLQRLVEHVLLYCKIEKKYDLLPKRPLPEVLGLDLNEQEQALTAALRKKYLGLIKHDPTRFVRTMFEDCRLQSGRPKILEKTPMHVLAMPLMRHVFPDAKFVFIHRKSKLDVLSSYYLMTKDEKRISRGAKFYDKASGLFDFYRNSDDDKVLCLWFGDVLAAPVEIFRQMYAFAGFECSHDIEKRFSGIRQRPSKFEKLDEKHKELVLRYAE